MAQSKSVKDEVKKYIQPMGDKQMLNVFMPILDKLQDVQLDMGYKILHFYCALCSKRPK